MAFSSQCFFSGFVFVFVSVQPGVDEDIQSFCALARTVKQKLTCLNHCCLTFYNKMCCPPPHVFISEVSE